VAAKRSSASYDSVLCTLKWLVKPFVGTGGHFVPDKKEHLFDATPLLILPVEIFARIRRCQVNLAIRSDNGEVDFRRKENLWRHVRVLLSANNPEGINTVSKLGAGGREDSCVPRRHQNVLRVLQPEGNIAIPTVFFFVFQLKQKLEVPWDDDYIGALHFRI